MAAGFLIGVAVLALGAAGSWALLHSAYFPVREVVLVRPAQKTTRAEIGAAVRARIDGNFFAVSPDKLREALEGLPWVRRASVRRVWPDRLDVTLEEHVAVARWGDAALVNSFGERFAGKSDEPLPMLAGPDGTESEMARRHARFTALVAPLGERVTHVVLTARFAWQLRLASGLEVMLGRDADAAEARLRRFVAAYDATLRQVPRRHEYVDLRYPNGFALRIPALLPGAKG